VPRTEIAVIVVNGNPAQFGHQVRDGDQMSVCSVFGAPDLSPLVRLDPPPLQDLRLVPDVHFGRLAQSLWFLGFDCVWRNVITTASQSSTPTEPIGRSPNRSTKSRQYDL
jgi:hypothetical protein